MGSFLRTARSLFVPWEIRAAVKIIDEAMYAMGTEREAMLVEVFKMLGRRRRLACSNNHEVLRFSSEDQAGAESLH